MKEITGKVIKTPINNTVMVEVGMQIMHPLYHKLLKRTKNVLAHCVAKVELDEVVVLRQCRPISKNKFFMVVKEVDKPIESKSLEQTNVKTKETKTNKILKSKEKISTKKKK